MPRAKAPVKRRPNSKRHAKTKVTSKRNQAPVASSRRAAPTFPAELMIAAPSGTRNRPVTTVFLPLPAVRDAGSERLLVRNAHARTSSLRADTTATTPITGASDARITTASDTLILPPDPQPDPSDQPEAAPALPLAGEPQPREGRIAATGGQPSASAVQVPTHPPSQAIPPVVPRPDTPVAALFAAPSQPASPDTDAKPLSRSAAVTTYRKNGPIDVLAYWLRTSQKSVVALFTRKKKPVLPKQAIIEINRLRLENLLLQRQIELLRSQLQVTQ